MATALTIAVVLLLIIGVIFNFLGAVGILVFPDIYTRLHAGTKTTTFGSIFLIFAVAVYGFARWASEGSRDHAVLATHALVALVSLLVTNPAGAHAVSRAARRSGIEPHPSVVDAWEEVEER